MKSNRTLLKPFRAKAYLMPLVLLMGLACVVISSYLLAGWMMRPVGDDYGGLLAYHIDSTWLTSIPHTILTGGGRYAQTFMSIIFYGGFGLTAMKFTAFLSIGLFILAAYLSIIAWQRSRGVAANHTYASIGAVLLLLFYTILSVTYPWVYGGIDNSFQGLLWLPGLITYTLPLELLVILIATISLRGKRITKRTSWLICIGVVSIILGTFNEIIPFIYADLLVFAGLYSLIINRFKIRFSKRTLSDLAPYMVVLFGLMAGLGLNYFSIATRNRREIFVDQQDGIIQILTHAFIATGGYFYKYVIPNYIPLLFTVLGGIVIGLLLYRASLIPKGWLIVKKLIILWVFSAAMAISAVYICFALVFKGYGNHNAYLVPRFEINYNVLLCLSLLLLGIVLAVLLSQLLSKKSASWLLGVHVLLTIAVVICLPYMFHQAAYRLRTVAVFSSNWQAQDVLFHHEAELGTATVVVPVIDIGEGYVDVGCNQYSPGNWLGAVKQQYYHIPKICSPFSSLP